MGHLLPKVPGRQLTSGEHVAMTARVRLSQSRRCGSIDLISPTQVKKLIEKYLSSEAVMYVSSGEMVNVQTSVPSRLGLGTCLQ